MSKFKKVWGYQKLYLGKSQKVSLTINRPINDEVFSSLNYLSEITEVGHDFIRSKGFKRKRDIEATYSLFQAFIRQGKTFFESAVSLEYRAQPLFYYYSFLNLTKAFLCINDHTIFKQKIYHGLVHKHKNTEFYKQSIKTDNGLFSCFYEQLFNKKISKNTSLNISTLFGYIPEIGYEHSLVNYGKRKFSYGKSRIFSNQTFKEFWPFLAIVKNDELFNNVKYFKDFLSFFDLVNMPKQDAYNILNINAENLNNYIFLQGKKTYGSQQHSNVSEIKIETIKIVEKFITASNTIDNFDYLIFMPFRNNLQIDFNNVLASYAVMYYLGSLVRYNPNYLESLLNSKHAWIIENFTKSVSSSFLLNINNLIQDKYFAYS